MAIQPQFETICVLRRKGEISEQIKAEQKTEIPSEFVSAVLGVSAFAVISQHEVVGASVRYGGKVVYYICYRTAEGEVAKIECGSEFSGALTGDVIGETCRVALTVSVDKAEADLSGTRLSASAYLTVRAVVSERAEIRALSGGEGLVVDSREVPYEKSFGIREGSFPIEEQFELPFPVAEVLSHRTDAVITSVQCGVGCIIVDGEAELSIIALQKNEKRDIIRENRISPFRMEIECEDAMPAMQAVAKVTEKSYKTDVAVDEDGGKSSVTMSAVLQFEGEAFSSGSAEIALDAFSIDEEVELIRENFPYYKVCDLRGASVSASGRSAVDELPVGATLCAVGGERAEIVSSERSDGKIKATGTVSATGFFRDGDGRIFSRKLETPFEAQFDCPMEEDADYDLIVKAERAAASIASLTEVEMRFELKFTVYPTVKSNVGYVGEVKSVGEKTPTDAAISVYIPMEGEDMWSLAKRLNVSPLSLGETNKDLRFPLTGKERIVVYRQK